MIHIVHMIQRRLDGQPANHAVIPMAALSLALLLAGLMLLLI